VVFHTDQGSEYTVGTIRAATVRLGLRQSMGDPGSALDNAVIESWHSTLELSCVPERFTTRAAARAGLRLDRGYSHHRRHSRSHDVTGGLRETLQAGEAADMSPLLRRPVSAGARPVRSFILRA
jgi:transposase InsO family protein